MSEVGKKVVQSADHRVQLKPFKPSISSSSATTTTKHQGLVKKEREPTSPTKHSLPKTFLHSANNNTVARHNAQPATPIGKATSSKATPKSSSKYEADKKEKKVYSLPGQKHDPPDEREPLRIFYGSLYQQNPKSEMAQIWLMEHGLLPVEAAKKALERKKKSQLNQKLGLPTKSSKSAMVKFEKVATKTMVVTPERKSFTSKTMVVTPERKSFTSNGDSRVLSKVKRKLELDSDLDDDRILKPKKKLSMSAQTVDQLR